MNLGESLELVLQIVSGYLPPVGLRFGFQFSQRR
jgi:hypothetical protein